MGRTGRFDEVPQWNLGPNPCYGYDDSMPHGGLDKELCKTYRSINSHFPEIVGRDDDFEEELYKTYSEMEDNNCLENESGSMCSMPGGFKGG